MGKPSAKEIKQKRDGANGAILVIPHVVLNCPAYLSLSGRAIKLLCDIAMQYNTHNNGTFLASFRHMNEKRGWTSADQLAKAKAELIAKGFLVQTVQGLLPNKASWYGITWWALDNIKGLEIRSQDWPRSAYMLWQNPPQEKNSLVRMAD